MKNKILIPLLILGALGAFFSFKYSGGDETTAQKEALILKTLMKAVKEGHYAPRDINDSFSTRVYHKLLDNMDPPTLRGAVTLIGRRVPTEASGGVRLETIRAIAETGVDYVSVGRITQSAPAADIGLDFSSL